MSAPVLPATDRLRAGGHVGVLVIDSGPRCGRLARELRAWRCACSDRARRGFAGYRNRSGGPWHSGWLQLPTQPGSKLALQDKRHALVVGNIRMPITPRGD